MTEETIHQLLDGISFDREIGEGTVEGSARERADQDAVGENSGLQDVGFGFAMVDGLLARAFPTEGFEDVHDRAGLGEREAGAGRSLFKLASIHSVWGSQESALLVRVCRRARRWFADVHLLAGGDVE